MYQVEILPPLKLKSQLKVSQVLPYLEQIAFDRDLKICIDSHMRKAWNEFRYLLIICEQYINPETGLHEPLQYWVKRDFRKAREIYNRIDGRNLSFASNN